MEEDETLHSYLQKVLIRIPQHLSQVDEHAIISALSKQKVNSVQDINFVRLIQDINQVFSPVIEMMSGEEMRSGEVIHIRLQNKALLASLYHESIQNPQLKLQQKIEIGYFIRMLLQTSKNIYSIDYIYDQDAFVDLILRNETDFKKQQEEYWNAIVKELEQDELIELWRYSNVALTELSEKLYQGGFTENPEDFYKAFSKSLTKTYNWKKKKTGLIYLFALIYIGTPFFPETIFEFIETKFTIKGKSTTTEVIRVQFKQIEDKLNLKDSQLKEQFLALYIIYKATIKKL